MASLFGAAAYAAWPDASSYWQQHVLAWTSAGVGATMLVSGVRALVEDYRLRKNLAASEYVSESHGSAREASKSEIVRRGMRKPTRGELLGLDSYGQTVWRPENAPFGYFEGPPGVGKSSYWVIPSALHRSVSGYSVLLIDPKCELGPMLIPGLRKLGIECHAINPAGQHLDIVGQSEHHPYGNLLDALYGNNEQRKDAVKIAADYASIHYADSADEKNPFFVQGSRRSIVECSLTNAMVDPTCATPTDVAMMLSDPARFTKRLRFVVNEMESIDPDDPVLAFAKVEARNLLHRAKSNDENFGAFLEGATQRFLGWNVAGRLGGYGKNATFRLSDMRKRPMVVVVMTPLSHKREFADFTSLLNHDVIAACKADPSGQKLHIIAEEALNYRFDNLVSDLETLRGLGVTADFYVQSYAGLEKMYGREGAAAIVSYCDVQVFTGLNSYLRAKHVSDMLSDMTLRQQEFSYAANAGEVNVSSREMRRSMMSPDEIMAMKPGTGWAFVRGMRPVKLRLVDYGHVAPWRDWVSPSPITGTKLYGVPQVSIDYTNWRKIDA